MLSGVPALRQASAETYKQACRSPRKPDHEGRARGSVETREVRLAIGHCLMHQGLCSFCMLTDPQHRPQCCCRGTGALGHMSSTAKHQHHGAVIVTPHGMWPTRRILNVRWSPHWGHDSGSITLPDTKALAQARGPNQQTPSSSELRGKPPESRHLCPQGLPCDQLPLLHGALAIHAPLGQERSVLTGHACCPAQFPGTG